MTLKPMDAPAILGVLALWFCVFMSVTQDSSTWATVGLISVITGVVGSFAMAIWDMRR